MLTASGGRRCVSPRGLAQGCSSAVRYSPGRPLRPHWDPGGRGPSRRLQPVFVASSRLTARWQLAAPGFARGCWGVVSFGVARTCSGPGASQGMHQPLQVAKSRGKNAPAPPPPAPSPGSGGRGSRRAVAAKAAAAGCGGSDAAPGASAPRNNWSRWSKEDARTAWRTVYRACELARCSRDGASRALTRSWPRAASRGSRGLSLAPPGARRHLA